MRDQVIEFLVLGFVSMHLLTIPRDCRDQDCFLFIIGRLARLSRMCFKSATEQQIQLKGSLLDLCAVKQIYDSL